MSPAQRALAAQTKREIKEGRASAKRLATKRKSSKSEKTENLKAWPIPLQDDPNVRLPKPVRRAIEVANSYYQPPRPVSKFSWVIAAWMTIIILAFAAAFLIMAARANILPLH